MSQEKIIKPANGYLIVALVMLLFFGGIYLIITEENPIYLLLIVVAIITSLGFILVNPNSSKVLLLFGKYIGTVKTNGLFWANPLYKKRTISLRASNFDSERLKVNDKYRKPHNDQHHFSLASREYL